MPLQMAYNRDAPTTKLFLKKSPEQNALCRTWSDCRRTDVNRADAEKRAYGTDYMGECLTENCETRYKALQKLSEGIKNGRYGTFGQCRVA